MSTQKKLIRFKNKIQNLQRLEDNQTTERLIFQPKIDLNSSTNNTKTRQTEPTYNGGTLDEVVIFQPKMKSYSEMNFKEKLQHCTEKVKNFYTKNKKLFFGLLLIFVGFTLFKYWKNARKKTR